MDNYSLWFWFGVFLNLKIFYDKKVLNLPSAIIAFTSFAGLIFILFMWDTKKAK